MHRSPSSIREKVELRLRCLLTHQSLVEVAHLFLQLHRLLGNQPIVGHIACTVLARIKVSKLSCKKAGRGEERERIIKNNNNKEQKLTILPTIPLVLSPPHRHHPPLKKKKKKKKKKPRL